MSNIASILQWLYPQATFGEKWIVEDDGKGQKIAYWNVPGTKKPTEAEVLSQESSWQSAMATKASQEATKKQAVIDWLAQSNITIDDLKKALS